MGATHEAGTQRVFYKLKKDETPGSKTFGMLQFYSKQKGPQGNWIEHENFNRIEGFLRRVEVKEYEFEGKKKEEMYFFFDDNQAGQPPFIVHVGFESIVAKNILNSLAGIQSNGVISLTCGKPREQAGKSWPTLYVNLDNEKTNWAYDKNTIPQITSETDNDGNNLKRGVAANNAFWKQIIAEVINPRFKQWSPEPAPAAPASNNQAQGVDFGKMREQKNAENMQNGGNAYNPSPETLDDLPF